MTKRAAAYHQELVDHLAELGYIGSDAVRHAFLAVPRERFVPAFATEHGLEAVYQDQAIPTKFDAANKAVSSSSQPAIMALMLERLDLAPGQRVLEVGAGTGYNAALLKEIVGPGGRVVSVDIDPGCTRDARSALRGRWPARVVTGDGREGYAPAAPYDRVVVTASSPRVPKAWWEQLRDGGLLMMVLRLSEAVFFPQVAVVLQRTPRGFDWVGTIPAGFMGLRPAADAPSPGAPELRAAYSSADDTDSFALSGQMLAGMSRRARRRSLALALSPPRHRRVPTHLDEGVFAFAALAAPRGRLLTWMDRGGTRWGLGLAEQDGGSLALLQAWKPKLGPLLCYGDDRARDRFRALIEAWEEAGQPSLGGLRVRVAYGRRPRSAWRTMRRGDAFLAFDWVPPL